MEEYEMIYHKVVLLYLYMIKEIKRSLTFRTAKIFRSLKM